MTVNTRYYRGFRDASHVQNSIKKGTGSAIVTKVRNMVGMGQCRDICHKTIDCRAFTYELQLGFCYLKSAQPHKCKFFFFLRFNLIQKRVRLKIEVVEYSYN